LLLRRRQTVIADFSNLPAAPAFADVSAIGRLAVDEFLSGRADEVFLVYTDFVNMVKQDPWSRNSCPLNWMAARVALRILSNKNTGRGISV
jgi:F-type H+-transporting ATPase subunit gamma